MHGRDGARSADATALCAANCSPLNEEDARASCPTRSPSPSRERDGVRGCVRLGQRPAIARASKNSPSPVRTLNRSPTNYTLPSQPRQLLRRIRLRIHLFVRLGDAAVLADEVGDAAGVF